VVKQVGEGVGYFIASNLPRCKRHMSATNERIGEVRSLRVGHPFINVERRLRSSHQVCVQVSVAVRPKG
jgi:hypothetical protein